MELLTYLLCCALVLHTGAFRLERDIGDNCGIDGANAANCGASESCIRPVVCPDPCMYKCQLTGTRNLALDMPTTQSGDYDATTTSDKAVDGCLNGDYYDENCVSITANVADPWWQVDLGQQYPIDMIVLFRRFDGYENPFGGPGPTGERWQDIQLYVSTVADTVDPADMVFEDNSEWPDLIIEVPIGGILARYVMLRIPNTIWLEITEVEVYGVPPCWFCDETDEQLSGHMYCDQEDTYGCVCDDGYWHPSRDPCAACEDIDECTSGENVCVHGSICDNIPASYNCACPEGYEFRGGACKDIIECGTPVTDCHHVADCVDVGLHWMCTCPQGYMGDGHYCYDSIECGTWLAHCDDHATCVDARGTYQCMCMPGFHGSGRYGDCEDIKECDDHHMHPCDRHATCLDDCNGSFTCTCNDGYVGSGYLGDCRPDHHSHDHSHHHGHGGHGGLDISLENNVNTGGSSSSSSSSSSSD